MTAVALFLAFLVAASDAAPEVVAAVCREDVRWLHEAFPDHLVVCSKRPCTPEGDASCSLDDNSGHESSSYAKYIVSRYDRLPDSVAFVHGHENSWHQFKAVPLKTLIKHANVTEMGFVSLNNQFSRVVDQDIPLMEAIWDALLKPYLGAFPCRAGIVSPACAQFVVSRSRIMALPRQAYQGILEFSQGEGWKTSNRGMLHHGTLLLEHMWPIVFGEPCVQPVTDAKAYMETRFTVEAGAKNETFL